ncbi:hypothetical protein ACJ41O_005483 [Fusarium nematophilum]
MALSSALPPMEYLVLNQQVSQIISAVQETTLFTSITPSPFTQVDASTAQEPLVTITRESTPDDGSSNNNDENNSGLKMIGVVEIAIAFGILVLLTTLVAGTIFCLRHRKAKKNRKLAASRSRMTGEKGMGGDAGDSIRVPAPVAGAVWPRMDNGQRAYEYWHNGTSRQNQGRNPQPQAGLPHNPPYYR